MVIYNKKGGVAVKRILVLLLVSILLVGCSANTEEYRGNLQSVADEMLEGAVEVEGILNQYSNIWDYSIKSRGAIPVSGMMFETGLGEDEVREYFQINKAGNVSDDFSTNLYSLNSYYEGTGKLDEIRDKSEDIKGKVSELNNPPSDYEKAYDELLDMYTYFEEFTEMALDPKGSLKTFNEEKNSIASDILSKHKRIEAVTPNDN